MNQLLKIQDLSKSFGGNQAVDHVSFNISPGKIIGLIGPNGSGKTTVLNMLSGILIPDQGQVFIEGRDITNLKPSKLAKLGVMRMFQMTRVFPRVSAFDNLLIAGYARDLSFEESVEKADALMQELELDHVKFLDAGELSGGQKKLLEFGMCFMRSPKLALLDEPFAAVHPKMREIMVQFISERHRQGHTFLVVSHDMPIVKQLCEECVCMNNGRVIGNGLTKEVLESPEVIEAYLGGHHD
ncbi:ABC transporter ATP-binding protein [Polynucleobacter rarus]|jgi:ABC-type branched-subunit amino acid transport system ATPase component|uniref:ABC transporter ATP-binding protein n=1 Tax=Polynucleobacter rarus TaxID=556055 RepID=UPI000D3E43E6|nr:ABC transporter ATP-binding protein [Polynucleobacter rarus]